MTASTISVSHSAPEARPGLRTFRSRRFRMVVATLLLVVGAAILSSALARQAADPSGQFAIDFADYQNASQRLATGASPYAPEMLAGPVDAQGTDRYRYPPLFAQALLPLSSLSLGTAASIWLVIQGIAIAAAVWVAGSAGGLARGAERLLWSLVAATWFLPAFDTLWKGNVSGIVALAVALVAVGGSAAVLGAVGGTLLKLVPVTFAPAAFLPADRRRWATAAILTGVVLAASVALSPRAWADYAVVVPNLLAGSADYATNLAPSAVASWLGAPEVLASIVRFLTLGVAAAAVFGSIVLARRPDGRHAALILGVAAMLLLPSALWYHYLVALLPVAAFSWARAGSRARILIAVGAGLVTAALAWLPLALVGAALMIGGCLKATWPEEAASG